MGVISGYFGGKVDMVIMRISDMMISFPGMILAIAVAGIMGGSLVNAVIALTIVSWTNMRVYPAALYCRLNVVTM